MELDSPSPFPWAGGSWGSTRLAEVRIRNCLSKLPEWAEGFARCLRVEGCAPQTVANYLHCLVALGREAEALGVRFDSLVEWSVGDVVRVLDRLAGRVKVGSLPLYAAALRRALQAVGRGDLAGEMRVPRRRVGVPEVLSDVEVKRLMEAAPSLRDRLIIGLLYETGMRVSELTSLRVKDVQFDEYGARIFVREGKGGTRVVRAVASKPDLLRWLNDHPFKNAPNAQLWLAYSGRWGRLKPLAVGGVERMVAKLGLRVLGKRVHPHMLRHTAFTMLSRYLTDRELKILGGWRSTQMLEVYSHLSGRDVEEKLLAIHGVKKPSFEEPLIGVRRCRGCGAENAPTAMYCHGCAEPLAASQPVLTPELKRTLVEEVKRELLSALKRGELQLIAEGGEGGK